MYADDLVMIAESENQLQENMTLLNNYCMNWNLEINLKKTKTMVFNRGNKLCKTNIYINNTLIECVKEFRYLGFTISAKNCSFLKTISDLKIKVNRAIFALNNKIKLSKLPTNLAIKLFNTQIKPILLYGSEIWAPYSNFNYENWDSCEIEQCHTQFLKRILGCNIQSPNVMIGGELGRCPLLTDIISNSISFLKHLSENENTLAKYALLYELQNNGGDDILQLIKTYRPDLINKLNADECKQINNILIKRQCCTDYQLMWSDKINQLPKAISYIMFKNRLNPEKYVTSVSNTKHKIALCRFRVSSHDLMIEKGRHFRPIIQREDRKCPFCANDIENETHFITKCPLYNDDRNELYSEIRKTTNHFDNLTADQKFIFIMTNEDHGIINKLAKYIYNAMKKRKHTELINQKTGKKLITGKTMFCTRSHTNTSL